MIWEVFWPPRERIPCRGEKLKYFQIVSKVHEMTGNDQKRVWEYHLGVGTAIFSDLGCPGRYSGVLESDFHVDYQNPKVGYGGEMFDFFLTFPKSQNFTT